MSFSNRVKCQTCIHKKPYVAGELPRCDAFPRGIPMKIFCEEKDHSKHIWGDHGIQYEPIPEEMVDKWDFGVLKKLRSITGKQDKTD